MALTYDDVKELHQQLDKRDHVRHRDLRALRRYWQGNYWNQGEGEEGSRAAVSSVQQLFLDLKGSMNDLGPDLKLVHNILQEVCVKYQTFLSPVPMPKTFIDPPYSDTRRKQSTTKERVINGTWWANRMTVRMAEVAWYLPLMGDCFPCIWPDFDRKIPRFIVRSPEIAHPIRSWDGTSLDQIMFRWEANTRDLKRQYPDYVERSPNKAGRFRPRVARANAGGERKAEVIEFSDTMSYQLWADDQLLKTIDHELGFNLFGQMSFIPVPGEVFNHGAVEQIVNLVEMGNALHSLLFQSVFENVFPMMVIEDPAKAPEQIMRGPGAVVPVNAGGKVYYETPPEAALGVQMAFMRDNADKILEASGMPRVNFGQSPTTSIATGAAINELQGAGSGSTVEMVQGTGIGPELVAWNEKALTMYQTVFKDDDIHLYGTERTQLIDINPRSFALSFKGSDVVGSTRNEVVFQPHMNDHEKLVMGLQGLGAGIYSKKYVREQLGIADNDAMVEEILAEQLEDGVLQAIVQQFAQQGAPAEAEPAALAQGITLIEGAPVTPPAIEGPHPLLAAGAPGTPGPAPAPAGPGGPPGPAGPAIGNFPGGPGQVVAPPLPLPQGAPPPGGSAPGAPTGHPSPSAGAGTSVTVQQALAAFQNVQINGHAWLVGEIAAKGRTSDVVEIALTDRSDEAPLKQAATFPVMFHIVTSAPTEQSVEING